MFFFFAWTSRGFKISRYTCAQVARGLKTLGSLLKSDQMKVYRELNGVPKNIAEGAKAGESKRFWSDIWSVEKKHKVEAHWLKDIKTDFGGRVVLTRETEVFKQVRNEKRKEKLVGSDEIGKCGYGCYWRSWLCDKKGRKMVKKVTS